MAPLIGVIMGSKNDFEVLQHACAILEELDIAFEARVVSAHRTPDAMFRYAEEAEARGLLVIIAAAGGAAHLPGMVAAKTTLPVLGVPIAATGLNGLDSLLSIVQMPSGIPVGTLAIGKAGAENAALLAASIVATKIPELRTKLWARRNKIAQTVLASPPLADHPKSKDFARSEVRDPPSGETKK